MRPHVRGLAWLAAGMLCAAALISPGQHARGQDAKKAAEAQRQDAAARRQYNTAAGLQKAGELETAVEEWRLFLQKHPQHELAPAAQHYLGVCLLKLQKYDEAAEAFAGMLGAAPQHELASTACLYLGMAHFNAARQGKPERYAQAIEAFQAVASKYGRSKEVPRALLYHADSLYDLGRKPEALQLYQQLVAKFPKDDVRADALYALGVTQQELSDWQAAGTTFGLLLREFPQDARAAEVTLRLGETLAAREDFAQAEKQYARAAASAGFAQADYAFFRQAYAVYQQQRYAQAAELFAELPRRYSSSSYAEAAVLWGGKSYYQAGRLKEARPLLEQASGGGGETALEAAHWLARLELKEGRAAAALEVAERGLGRAGGTPWQATLKLDRADALFEDPARRRESVAAYAALAAEHPQDTVAADALYLAAYAALDLKDYEQALQYSQAFLQGHRDHRLAADVLFIAAESQRLTGRNAEAAASLAQLLERFPNSAEVPTWLLRRGLVLLLDRQYAEVLSTLEPARRKFQQPEQAAEALYLVGRAQAGLGKFDASERALKESLAAHPAWPQHDATLLALAHALRQQDNLPAARQRLAELVQNYPRSALLDRAHASLGEYADAAGDHAAAAREFALVLDGWPNSPLVPNALYGLALAKASLGEHEAAVGALDRLLAGFGDHPLAAPGRFARAQAKLALRQFDSALADVQAYLATKPARAEQSDAAYLAGLCYAGLNQAEQAAAVFSQLLQEDPGYRLADEVLYQLGWALRTQAKHAEAADTFARLGSEYPASSKAAEALFLVGEHHYEQKQYVQAAQAYYASLQKEAAAELRENAAHKLGFAYFRNGELEKAQQTFAFQRSTFPNGRYVQDALFMEGECWFKLEKFAEALELYRQVKNPQGKDFMVLALLHAGQAAAKLERWDESLALLQKAEQDFPQAAVLAEIIYGQAFALHHQDQLQQALPLYERVTELSEGEVAARARFMVGEICFQQKKHSEAVRHFFKADAYGYPEWQAAAQYEAGRCFEVLGKKEQARKAYQQAVEKHPNGEHARLARERLAALGG